jgi:hypothetical protein
MGMKVLFNRSFFIGNPERREGLEAARDGRPTKESSFLGRAGLRARHPELSFGPAQPKGCGYRFVLANF